jgi:hypothetical protein
MLLRQTLYTGTIQLSKPMDTSPSSFATHPTLAVTPCDGRDAAA